MMNRAWLLSMAVAFGLLSGSRGAAEELAVGKPAPAFTLAGSDGKEYSLADFKGKSGVVLAWYPKSFTGGCTAECKSMAEASKALKETSVAYFAVSCDDQATQKKFAESLSVDYPILADPDRTAAKAYGVVQGDKKNAARWTFYIDKEGIIRHIDKKVNTKSHGPDIAAKVAELKLNG